MGEPIGEETLRRVEQMDRVTAWIAEKVLADVGQRVIEVGSGRGTFTSLLLDRERVVAVEPNTEYNEKLHTLQTRNGELKIVNADFTDPACRDLKSEKCDTVICLNVLEHIADDCTALDNMNEVLIPGGKALLLVPALRSLYGTLDVFLYHHRRYERDELRDKLRNSGFRIEQLTYFNLFGMLGWWLNSKVMRRKILPSGQLTLYNKLVPVFRKIEESIGPPIGQSLWAVAVKE
jgi:SAM-dependent methyltransferase